MLRSERKPRVEVRPAGIVGSFGPEALELGLRAGIAADDWQADALNLLLSFRSDGMWACREYCEWVARQNGKGVILELRVLAGLFLLGEKTILWSAHEVKTAKKAARRMRAHFGRLGTRFERRGSEHYAIDLDGERFTVKVGQTNGQESFEILETGQLVLFVARSKGSGRGIDAVDLNIIDETFAYTFEQQDAIGPTQRAALNPQTIYTSSPPLDGVSGEVMHRLRKRAESADPGRLGYRDFGAAGRLEDLRELSPAELAAFLSDVERWANTNPALGTDRLTLEDVENDLASMSEMGFAREILGIWPRPVESAGGTIDAGQWADLEDTESKLVGRVRFALDTSPDRSHSTVAVAGRRADGRFHVEVIDAKPGTGWVVARTAELYRRWDCGPVVIDPRSAAGAFIQPLIEAGVEVELITTAELGQATGEFIDALTNDQLRHIGQQSLTTAALGGQLRPVGDAYAWARKDISVDITPLVAATLALHGTAAAPEPEDVEPWVMTEDDWEDD
ncbi:hypothetical protein [Actinophytocola sp. NPDC049390]|uniref:hypothetical protein n=1 Tax=Actinophytocola sp. NPDC049390 TaxID=3363894 RepID=UPI0037B5670D